MTCNHPPKISKSRVNPTSIPCAINGTPNTSCGRMNVKPSANENMTTHTLARLATKPRPLSHSLARFTSAAAVCAALMAGASSAHAAPATWDADGLQNGTVTSGSGTWDNAALNFTDPTDALLHFAWNNVTNATDVAAFGGAGGVAPFNITVGTITAGGVQFDTAGYILNAGTLTLNSATIVSNVDGRINSIVAGAGGITTRDRKSVV